MSNRTAIVYGKQHLSFTDLLRKIEGYALLFTIEKEDRVVVFSENRPGWMYSFYSIWKNKGIPVPIDYMATASEVAFILNDCSPKVIFCSNDRESLIKEAIAIAGIDAKILSIDDHENTDNQSYKPNGSNILEVSQSDETAVIIYTSGTTGSPKGVMLSYLNILTNVNAVSNRINIYNPESKVLVLLPLHHILPLVGTMIIPFHLGAMVAISPSMASADIIDTLQQNKITIIIGVPRLYAAIRKGIIDKIDASFLAKKLFSLAKILNSKKFSKLVFGAVHRKLGGAVEVLVAGGAALDPVVGSDFQTLGFEVLEGYGMTEAAPMITFTRPGRVRIGSPGEVMPETKMIIVDDEILASGPNIMKGYYNRPEETAEVLVDGWLHTGDLGRIDNDGYLFITGRKKEIIILSNGKNVNPVELEEKLLQYELVKDCGVFYKDDQLQLIVIPDAAGFTDTNLALVEERIKHEVIEPFNKTVSSYKKLMRFFVTSDELPRTRLGKLQRFKLSDLAIDTSTEKVSETENEVTADFKLIAAFIHSEKGRKALSRHHIEFDLGMDSLDKIGFQVYLKQTFGVNLEPVKMLEFNTIQQLADWVTIHKTKTEDSAFNWKDILREKVHLQLPRTWFTGNLTVFFSKIFFHTYFRFNGKGLSNLPDGPFILAPNHQSYFDGLLVASFLQSKLINKTYFYAKEKHIRRPWMKFLANRNNVIIMDLNRELKESIQKLAEVLKQNKNLIIFPEGTRSDDGRLGQFKKTFAILSRELNVPVVPVSISGAFEALPRGSWFPKPLTKIKIEFLKPVYPKSMTYDNLSELVRQNIQINIDAKSV
ncbi:MAG: AMP-binding protein [Bacteroidales bacterium]|nr:AMP-binding protein [Bacteroidales bacterium]